MSKMLTRTSLIAPICAILLLTGCTKADHPADTKAAAATASNAAVSSPTTATAASTTTTATASTGKINYVQESASDAHKTRQKIMKDWGNSLKTVGGMVKDPTSFNAATLKVEAAKLSTDPWVHFAPGTKADRAKSEIWDKPDQFQAEVDKYKKAVVSLNTAAQTATSVDSVKAPFGEVAASCKSCHTAFRTEE